MKIRKFLIFSGFTLGWFALIGQFVILLEATRYSLLFTVINFFSYFTILTNIITALCFTLLLFKNDSLVLQRPGALTAIAVYITIVGLVYNIILRFIWSPSGMAMLVDELLHTIIPLLYIIYWLKFADKRKLKYKHVPFWLVFPVIYVVYTFIRGELTGFYPYPFLDAGSLGKNEIYINIAALILLFLFFSFLYIGIGKFMSSTVFIKNRTKSTV